MPYASGKHSQSLCDKCGLTFRYKDIRNESGTGFRVCQDCDDTPDDLINHPQNGPFPVGPEGIAVRYPRPDVPLAISWEAEDTFQQIPTVPGGEEIL